MRSAYHLLTVRGIPIRVHITFVWFPIWAAFTWSARTEDMLRGALFGVIAALLLFGCVTLHELGHALVAQKMGIKVEDITLLPFGGLARLRTIPREPKRELAIAIAGPLVNVVIFLLLAFVAAFTYRNEQNITPQFLLDELDRGNAQSLLIYLMLANVILVLFNLIPAFPLDGGRMLRGTLGLFMDWSRATRWATTTGQGLAIGMGTWGLVSGQVTLTIIAVLIFMSAGATHAEERSHSVLAGRYVGDACNRHALALTEQDRLSTVMGYLLTSYQPDFAVLRGGELLGVVRRAQVLQTLAGHANDPLVTAIMTRVPTVWADRTLDETRRLLEESDVPVAAVYGDFGYLGLVSLEDIAEAEAVLAFAEAGIMQPPRAGVNRWFRAAVIRRPLHS